MDLDTTTLKESRLGPIVLFYTKTKRVTPAINRQADALVQNWSRPIIKRPANFRSRYVETAGEMEERLQSQTQESNNDTEPSQIRKQRRFNQTAALAENDGRRMARLPIAKVRSQAEWKRKLRLIYQDVQYTVAPESRMVHDVEDLQHVSRIQMDNKKYNKFARQLKTGRAR